MNMISPTPNELLLDIFLTKKSKNQSYSTHAFARDLGVSQTLVSLLLSGKKKVSLKLALKICGVLGLDETQTRHFMQSVTDGSAEGKVLTPLLRKAEKSKTAHAPFASLQLDRFRFISQWHHIAILDLTTVAGFKPEEAWIAKALGLSTAEVRDSVKRLVRLGLLSTSGGRWTKTNNKIAISTNGPDPAIRAFHKQMIHKAEQALDSNSREAFSRREISSATMAVNSGRLTEAKKRIEQFKRELIDFLSEGECDSLFQLNVQLFSLMKEGDGK